MEGVEPGRWGSGKAEGRSLLFIRSDCCSSTLLGLLFLADGCEVVPGIVGVVVSSAVLFIIAVAGVPSCVAGVPAASIAAIIVVALVAAIFVCAIVIVIVGPLCLLGRFRGLLGGLLSSLPKAVLRREVDGEDGIWVGE